MRLSSAHLLPVAALQAQHKGQPVGLAARLVGGTADHSIQEALGGAVLAHDALRGQGGEGVGKERRS